MPSDAGATIRVSRRLNGHQFLVMNGVICISQAAVGDRRTIVMMSFGAHRAGVPGRLFSFPRKICYANGSAMSSPDLGLSPSATLLFLRFEILQPR